MTAEIIDLPCITRLDRNPQRVLSEALKKEDLTGVFIMGYTLDGNVYFASSYADGGTVMWLMELAKARLVKIAGEPK